MATTVEERFWSKVERGDGCWLWTASCNRDGYGQAWVAPKMRKAHRVAWELTNGSIPDGLRVCHTCDTPRCVRPDHLFLGTDADNMADMFAKGRDGHRCKTHCPRGHEYTADNTYVNARGQRSCRTCTAARAKAFNRAHWRRYAKSRATGRPKGTHNATKTQCKFGHPFSIENTRITSSGARKCRACDRDRYWARRAG